MTKVEKPPSHSERTHDCSDLAGLGLGGQPSSRDHDDHWAGPDSENFGTLLIAS